MSGSAAAAAQWRRYRWEHPEWPLSAVALLAWAVVLLGAGGYGIAHMHGSAPWATTHAGRGVGEALAWWLVMVAAMMLPLARADARWLANRSLARRRGRTVVLHILGFAGVWSWLGVAVVAIAALGARGPAVGAGALAVAAAWHVGPTRRRYLLRCGRGAVPAITGLRATTDCFRAGARTGWRCLVTCGFAMAAMAAVHSFVLMAAIAVLTASERRAGPSPARRAGRRSEGLGFAAVAIVVAGAAARAAV